jgi:hypothetical protein
VRYAEVTDVNVLGYSAARSDVALLYGRRHAREREWVRAAGGIGFVRVTRLGDCNGLWCAAELVSSTVGIACQVDAVWAPIPSFGIGLGLFGSVNAEEPFAGLMMAVHVGGVR